MGKRNGKAPSKGEKSSFFFGFSSMYGFFLLFRLFHREISLWKEEKDVVFLRIRKGFPQEQNSAFPLFPFQYLQGIL